MKLLTTHSTAASPLDEGIAVNLRYDVVRGPELQAAVAPLRKGRRYEIGGLTRARVPRGYDADHPRAKWLLHDGLWATRGFEDTKVLHTPAFVDRCFELCREMAPLHRWLVTVDRRAHGRRQPLSSASSRVPRNPQK
jgi:hypothetical protein